jgi:hypothetical protein
MMDEKMYEDRASMRVWQSADLDWDAARAEWERQGEGADRLPACDVCERTPARRCKHDNLLLCDACADTDEHREYCEMVQDGGAE